MIRSRSQLAAIPKTAIITSANWEVVSKLLGQVLPVGGNAHSRKSWLQICIRFLHQGRGLISAIFGLPKLAAGSQGASRPIIASASTRHGPCSRDRPVIVLFCDHGAHSYSAHQVSELPNLRCHPQVMSQPKSRRRPQNRNQCNKMRHRNTGTRPATHILQVVQAARSEAAVTETEQH